MVSSEEGSSMVKRKEHDNTEEAEWSGKKKKKKQVGAPRPACSWVHFSREFIKEYSATHPESSGLKSATKAASHAWNLMSPEEKDIYTKRAREVWNNYLSSAPPREHKPRKQAKLVTRCSPGRVLNVLNRLSPEQKDAVKSMGFGSLLDLRCQTLRRNLCLWLLERFNTVRCTLDICGDRIPLSSRDVKLVMGLSASGNDVVTSGPNDLIVELRHKYNAKKGGISVRLLEERLAAPEAGEDFKRSFVLYALGTLLCPTARLDVSPSFLHILTNMDVVHQFNWGKFLLDRLVREVFRFRQGKQRAVGGCLLFLQLFYYESVAVEGPFEPAPIAFPCLSSWGEEEITEREKRERDLGGYGCGEVVWKERCLKMGLLYEEPRVNTSSGETVDGVEHDLALEQENRIVMAEGGGQVNGDLNMDEENMLENLEEVDVVFGEIEMDEDTDYDSSETVHSTKENDKGITWKYIIGACPIDSCEYCGTTKQLSQHFRRNHLDSGYRFRYNFPVRVTLNTKEKRIVLQAEEDGALYLVNRSTKKIGHILTVTRVGPVLSKTRFLYDLVSECGVSSLRLKAYSKNYSGRVSGFLTVDFMLVPFSHVGPSGELNLEVCIWSSTCPGTN